MRRLYGLVGRPLGHSFSRSWMNAAFAAAGIDAFYDNHELEDIAGLMPLVLGESRLMGLNVTAPYKEAVIPFLDELSPEAEAVGAVNVVDINREGTTPLLTGFNTDVEGFKCLLDAKVPGFAGRALVLGTGGASKAAAKTLNDRGIGVTAVSRHPRGEQIGYGEIDRDVLRSCLLIVNATPLGMGALKDEAPPLPYGFLTPDHTCIDLVYNPAQTVFMRRSAAAGASAANGLEMLVGQARASLRVWLPDKIF